MKRTFLGSLVVCTLIFSACKKDPEVITSDAISDFAPLAVGKYITYQLDSLVYQNFGTSKTIISYQVKYEVSDLVKDNLDRPAYRITRYIRKAASNQWVPDNSFSAINTGLSLEFIENNMRFLKMKLPIKDGYSWKGNSYIDTYSFNSDVKYLDDWDYMYDSLNTPITLGNITLDNTVKVDQRDEIIGNPSDPNSYSEINYSSENYAKGIGMVYRRMVHLEYQPPTPGTGGAFSDGSFGITLTMIDHN